MENQVLDRDSFTGTSSGYIVDGRRLEAYISERFFTRIIVFTSLMVVALAIFSIAVYKRSGELPVTAIVLCGMIYCGVCLWGAHQDGIQLRKLSGAQYILSDEMITQITRHDGQKGLKFSEISVIQKTNSALS